MPAFSFDQQQQQQQPGNVFSWIDELQASLPRMTPWILAVVGGLGGFFYASTRGAEDYTVALVAAGFLGGMLLIQLVAFALKALVALIIVATIAVLAYWLFGYQSAHHRGTSPSHMTVQHTSAS